MTPDDELQQRLLNLFAGEAQDVIQAITQSCLALEQQPGAAHRADLTANILRQAHNLKGTARALGLEDVFSLTHRLEALFEAIKQTGVEPETAVFDLIYQTLDGINSLIAGPSEGNPALDLLLNRLETAVAHINTPQTALAQSAQTLAAAETAAPDAALPASQETIRVTVGRLDTILNLVNELQISRLSLERNLRYLRQLSYNSDPFVPQVGVPPPAHTQISDLYRRAETDHRRLSQLLAQLQENVHQARMLPLTTIFDALPRIARDLAHELGKEVVLHLEGGDIELDRAVLEQLKSPLQHLLRNGIDHGLETPEKRRAAGKAMAGQISITAVQRGGGILLEISDDGAGIDQARIKEQAIRQRLLTADESNRLNEQEALWLLFRSGFSLAGAVTAVSGRGVGLDIVRQAVESLHGVISLENRPGQGVRFSLSLPVSIASSCCLLVRAAGQMFALPTRQVAHLARVAWEQVQGENGRLRLLHPGAEPIPAISLGQALQGNGHSPDRLAAQVWQTAVFIGPLEQPVALLVDEPGEVQEIVIKPLPLPLAHMPYISGASILGTGAVILVLNVTDLIRAATQRG
ncbi:MAG: chemotaxis protein CheW [Chloroflexi bacterium]|nr:chemotaxis protein CheW [Chloroflexota bacterium]